MYTIGSGTATDITAALMTPIEVDGSPRARFLDEPRQSKIASARTSMLSRGSTHR